MSRSNSGGAVLIARTGWTIVAVFVVLVLMTARVFAGMEPGTFKLNGKGYLYYHHSFAEGAAGQDNSFDISRLYLGVKYQLAEEFMVSYLTDITHQDQDGKLEVFSKYAYLDWKLSPCDGHLLLGLQSTYNWKSPEKAWGYRSIRKAPMESFGDFWGGVRSTYDTLLQDWAETLLSTGTAADSATAAGVLNRKSSFATGSGAKMGSSADLGLGLLLKPSAVTYAWFVVRNGGGYKKKEHDQYKNFQLRVGGYFLKKALHLSAFGELEPWKGVDDAGAPKRFINTQWDVMASYEQKGLFLIGANVNAKTFAGDTDDLTAMCVSGFGNVYLLEQKLKALARVDYYQSGFNDAKLGAGAPTPETDAVLFIVGLDYIPAKNVHIIPNVQVLSFEDDNKSAVQDFFVHVEFKF